MCKLKDHLFMLDRFIHKHRFIIMEGVIPQIIIFIFGFLLGYVGAVWVLMEPVS